MAVAALLLLVLFVVSIICLFPRRTRRAAKWSAPASFVAFIIVAIIAGGRLNEEARALGFSDDAEYRAATAAGINDPVAWKKSREEKEAFETEQRKAQAAQADAKRVADIEEKERQAREASVALERQRAAEADQKARALAAAKAAEEAKMAECRSDLGCWGDKHSVRATVYCKDPVTRLAKNDFQWIDGMLESKFSHYRWADKTKGVVTFIGDRIKFQNGFGAWIIHTYECDFDTASERPVEVRARPGRIPAG